MKPSTYTAAVIGLGKMSRSHLKCLSDAGRFELVAVCERDATTLEAAELAESVSRFSDLETMMQAARPDLVIIVTPNSSHAALTEAVAAYKPRAILCEKPMSTHYSDAVAMVASCESQGVELLVNHQRRLVAGVVGRGAIDRGLIGDLLEIDTRCAGDFMSDGTHAVDIALCLGGDLLPKSVFGAVDLGAGQGERYGHAVEVSAYASWFDEANVRYSVTTGALTQRTQYQQYRVRGTKGELWHPGGPDQPHWYLNDGSPGDFSAALGEDRWFTMPVPAPEGGPWRRLNARPESSEMIASLELLAEQLDGELDRHPLNGREALNTHAVVNACYLSALRRQSVEFPLPEDSAFVIDALFKTHPES